MTSGAACEPAPVEIPIAALSPGALRGLVESVVLREGTDYGADERSFEEKVEELLGRLGRGEARIVFALHSQTPNIVAREGP